MDRTERVELTVLCLIRDGERYLLQDRAKGDWTGFTLPVGHVEHNKEKLRKAYEIGRAQMTEQLEELKRFLAE